MLASCVTTGPSFPTPGPAEAFSAAPLRGSGAGTIQALDLDALSADARDDEAHHLLAFLDHCVEEGMLKPKNRELLNKIYQYGLQPV